MTLSRSTALQRLIDALRDHGCTVKESGATTMAQCPAHNDDNPSLSIGPRRDGRGAVIKCHAGCSHLDVLAELNMTERDLFDDDDIRDVFNPNKTYAYPHGRKNHRGLDADGEKTFWQEGSGDKSLYGANLIGDALTVYLCEGEKAADLLRAMGYTAVATGGSQRTCDLEPLAGRVVMIIADRDPAGREWAQRQHCELENIALWSAVFQAKPEIDKADIVEHISADFTVEELEPIDYINSANITETEDPLDKAVHRRALELRIADEGRALWNRQRATLMGQQAPSMVSMQDFLSIPDEDTTYRVDEVFPVGARILLAAQYKAGKTSLIANLLRSLVDGDSFLGRFRVAPIEKVLLIDTELDERTLRRWLREQTIQKTAGINVLSLRGRLASFAINDDRVRADWAERIGGAQVVLLDCLRPCLDALGLSEDKEAGIFLTAFDALCHEAGADEAVVVHHMGHTQERSRGDSRLLDWPDALWKLVREEDEDGNSLETGNRFFSALGRDVHVGESQLDWQPETRTLSICGGTRTDLKAQGARDDIIEVMLNPANFEGLSQTALVAKLKAVGVGRNVARLAVKQAVGSGLLLVTTGSRDAKIHTLNPSWRKHGDETPGI